jgi:hypothetical protein
LKGGFRNMKKEWSNAVIETLEISETAGGKDYTGVPDGDWFYYDGCWYQPGGKTEELS